MKPLLYSLMMTVLVLVFGCSTLQTKVNKNVDWSAYTSVAISVSDPDRWELRPLVAERLAGLGLTPLENNQNPDLLAIIEAGEGTSLAETGGTVHWPEDLLLRILDSSDGSELARSRYQLAATQSLRHGLTLMVNDLRKQISTTTGAGSGRPPQVNKTATTSDRAALKPIPAENGASLATVITNNHSEQAAAAPDSAQPREEHSTPEAPTSDWVPRFKGWQLWGEDTTAGEAY